MDLVATELTSVATVRSTCAFITQRRWPTQSYSPRRCHAVRPSVDGWVQNGLNFLGKPGLNRTGRHRARGHRAGAPRALMQAVQPLLAG